MTAGEVRFPDAFLWGAATSSHQIEGDRAGRLENVWDRFSRVPGKVLGGDDGDVACDHLRLMADDVALMAELGLRAYRFSISWARADAGPGGLDPYRRLVALLREHGIEPMATLYHWDHPTAIEDRGGWRSRDTASRFAEYAARCAIALGDGVGRWCTLNEPWCAAYLGNASGEHAPGRRDPAGAVAAAHHQLVGHGLATQALRAAGARSVGLALNPAPVHGDGSLDDDVLRRIDGTLNRSFLDPVLTGRYPGDVLDDLGGWAAPIRDGDAALIGQPIDWLGINYYNDHTYQLDPTYDPADPQAGGRIPSPHVTAPQVRPAPPVVETTGIGWPITPGGFERMLVSFHERYGSALPPIVITENGAAYDDPVVDGACDDQRRIAYLDGHLRALHGALAAGVPVAGYLVWSLLDNFEWAWGYSQRFGIVHVDFATQVRTPKSSARWYADVIRTGQLPPPDRHVA